MEEQVSNKVFPSGAGVSRNYASPCRVCIAVTQQDIVEYKTDYNVLCVYITAIYFHLQMMSVGCVDLIWWVLYIVNAGSSGCDCYY